MNHAPPSVHFIISAPRSGSTWLAQALNGHPEIFATENRLFGSFCEIWQNNDGKFSPRITFDKYAATFAQHTFFQQLGCDNTREFQNAFVPAYLKFLAEFLRSRSGKPVIVDKITPYLGTSSQVVDQIRRWCPDSRIIHLIRDGRDVATSGIFDWIRREPQDAERRRLFVDKEPGLCLERFFDDESLATWCRYWREPIESVTSTLDDALTVGFESMLNDQPRELMRIFKHLGVDADATLASDCAHRVSFERTTGRASGQDDPLAKARKGVAGDWRNYFTRADAQRFDQLAGQTLIEHGFESDHSWVDGCPARLALRCP